jgi:phytoene/squalene synthetase
VAANEDYCLAHVQKGDRDRYLALLFSPAQQRGELAAIAAFNLELARAISEISEPTLSLIRLQWWREAIEEIAGGAPVRRHPVAEALQAATRARRLSTVRMLAMIGAREEEIDFPGAPREAAFDARADSGPANLIRLSLQVAEIDPDAPALALAIGAVGRAYALTGCARSVLIDAPIGACACRPSGSPGRESISISCSSCAGSRRSSPVWKTWRDRRWVTWTPPAGWRSRALPSR